MDTQHPLKDIKRRSFISTMSLFFQSGYSAFLGLIANLILTILLSPTVFGIYITVLSIISFLNYFSDIGMAGALIQKKELREEDLVTTFTVQQGLTLALILFGFFATPTVSTFYNLPPEGSLLFQALLISFFISSMKTVPSVFLERKIKFEKIVLVQIVENTIFYVAVSVLAIMGFGLTSFTVAVLLRSVVGLILIYALSPWMPKIGIHIKSLRSLLSFGVPFQASSFLALFKDDLIILYLGKVVGFEGVGYIGWAKKWADAPIRIIMDNVGKVLFPLLSRYQDSRERLRTLSEKILYYQTSLLAPTIIGMLFAMQYFVNAIPNYQKWQPALPLFYIFATSSLILSFSAPFMNLFNALGKVKLSFSFMLFFTVLTWILTPPFTKSFGYWGFPMVHFITSVSFILVLLTARHMYKFRFVKSVAPFLISTVMMGVALSLYKSYVMLPPIPFLAGLIGLGVLVYMTVVTYVFKISLSDEVKMFLKRD